MIAEDLHEVIAGLVEIKIEKDGTGRTLQQLVVEAQKEEEMQIVEYMYQTSRMNLNGKN